MDKNLDLNQISQYPNRLYCRLDSPILSKHDRRRRREWGALLVSLQDDRNRQREENRLAVKRVREQERIERITKKRQKEWEASWDNV